MAVETQGAVTQEIARNVTQAAEGAVQVATSIIDVNHGADETGTARHAGADAGMARVEDRR